MGVVRWLDRIDPAVWERATAQVAAEGAGLLERAAAAAFLRDFGREPTDDDLGALDDADDESLHPTLLNGLLERAVTEVSWELDKSLNAFASVAAALPGGRALSSIIDFKGIDAKVPEACAMIESGLYGCCSAAALTDCLRLVRRFGSPAEVQAALGQNRPGLLARLLGRAGGRGVSKVMSQDYYIYHWQALCAAVVETAEQGHYLGLGMSP